MGATNNGKKSASRNSAGGKTELGLRSSRRTPRRVYSHPVGILCQGVFNVVQAEQLSEGGVGFLAEGGYPPQAKVVITMILPGGELVVTRGEILSPNQDSGPGRVAAKFHEMSLQLRRRIRNYVAGKTQQEAEEEAAAMKKNDAA